MPKPDPRMPSGDSFEPLTPDRWGDLEALFGTRGACGGCWCMAWRLRPEEFRVGKDQPAPFVWTGLPSAFVKAGFKEVARRSKTRPIMRRRFKPKT